MSITWIHGSDYISRKIYIDNFQKIYNNSPVMIVEEINREVERDIKVRLSSNDIFDSPGSIFIFTDKVPKFTSKDISLSKNLLFVSTYKPKNLIDNIKYIEIAPPNEKNFTTWFKKISNYSEITFKPTSLLLINERYKHDPLSSYNVIKLLTAASISEPTEEQVSVISNISGIYLKPWEIATNIESGKLPQTSIENMIILNSYLLGRYLTALRCSEDENYIKTLPPFQKSEYENIIRKHPHSTILSALEALLILDIYVKSSQNNAEFEYIYIEKLKYLFK